MMNPGEEVKVLDHGYVRVVATMGTEETIVEAARMSTGRGFVSWSKYQRCRRCGWVNNYRDAVMMACLVDGELGGARHHHDWQMFETGDEAFLAFLWKNKHATPFEMCELHVEVMAPIFVFREWQRHRTQSYNEMSARYTPLPDVNYVPSVERLMINARGANKQAAAADGASVLTEASAEAFRHALVDSYAAADGLYRDALASGVPKELARVHLPVGRYSRMRAKANLRNWLNFLTLRTAPAAQWEIRQYAVAVAEVVRVTWPRVHGLWSAAVAP